MLFLALLASQAAVLVLSPILVEVARDLDVSTAAAGQLRSVTGLVAGLVALGFGRVGRGVSLRDLLLLGAGLVAVGSLLSAVAPSFAVFALAQLPVGAGVAVLVSAGGAAAGEWVAAEERGRVLSWTLIGPAVAWVVGMPLVGLVAGTSWRLAFLVLPVAAAFLVGSALSLCRREQLPAVRPLVRLRDLGGHRAVRAWAVAELLSTSAWAGTLVYCGALFVEAYDTSAAATGLLLGGIAVAYLPGNFAARRVLRRRGAPAVLPWLTLAGATGVAVLGCVRPSVAVSAAVLAALSFAAGGRTYGGGALGLELAPRWRLAVMGLRTSAGQFGYLVGSAAGGVALFAGGYPALGLLYAALYLAATAAYLRVQKSL